MGAAGACQKCSIVNVKKKSLFTMFARAGVTEWGKTTFLSFSLLLGMRSPYYNKKIMTEANRIKTVLKCISLAISLHLYITVSSAVNVCLWWMSRERNYNWTLTREGRIFRDQNNMICIASTLALTETWLINRTINIKMQMYEARFELSWTFNNIGW